MNERLKNEKAITLIALVITIIILLILAEISIASLIGSGLFEKAKQAKRAQIESEIFEKLNLAINELQLEKEGSATVDDITQEWAESELKGYNPKVDNSNDGENIVKIITLTKDEVTKKYKINSDLSIEELDSSEIITWPEIEVSTPIINTNANETSSLGENTQTLGTTLYINFKATLGGTNCTIEPTLPYAITQNGIYKFTATGTFQDKTITKEIEVVVGQYQSAQGVVAYDAGTWTQEEINELKELSLYDENPNCLYNPRYKLSTNDKDDSNYLNFTFGGFKAGDSRNDSVNLGTVKYSGWQILESSTKTDESGNIIKNADGTDRQYVTKIMHAGIPENFVFDDSFDREGESMRVVYLLSSGLEITNHNKLYNGTVINPRNWQMYVDNKQKDLIADIKDKDGNTVKDVHIMTYKEALAITGSTGSTDGIRNVGANYWLKSYESSYGHLYFVHGAVNSQTSGNIAHSALGCYGIRPVISLKSEVYIASGTGTDSDPYILAKE